MNRYIKIGMLIILSQNGFAQHVGIGTTSPQATLDVKGNQRLGGAAHFMTYDSVGGKIEWRGSNLYVPVSQYLMQHSAAADGLYYNNTAPISGQLEYRNEFGNPVFFTNFLNGNGYFKSNLGIGNLTPQFPLSLNGTLGDKISLWTDGTPTHYGFGIQPGLLQIFSKTDVDDIAFGYGNSISFAERARIKNNGEFGMELNGRLLLRNGTSPVDPEYGPGIWLTKSDNIGLLGFMGTQNNQNIGFFGGPAGWGFTYDAINSRVGIGNTSPNAPLSFPPALGKKITLYPGTTGDVGMAVQGNLLQIYSDNPNADIALGYDQGGVFTERFRVRANGSLMLNGNAGNPGQLIQSNGSGGAPVWVDPPPKVQYYRTAINNTLLTDVSTRLDIPIPVTIYANSIITVSVTVDVITANFFGCDHGQLSISFEPLNGGGLFSTAGRFETPCGRPNTIATGEHTLLASNGTSKVFTAGTAGVLVGFVKTSPNGSPDIRIGNSTPAVIIVKVIPL